ncbi:hypothetical protein MHUMG1_05066 [Metarhizium humberi]|uniref:Uncharacterized protein n=1 Tax=Metarhizium humberi TaxID=2596975 RepID=A0A9P8MA84_9HYPO|nr:hypothetical protein MHUMG1_05066 [Metarhizium humberi]
MILVAFGPALILGFLVSFTQAFGNPFEYGTRPEPGHLSGVGPRDSPPDYGPPSYGYGYPPPYQYETSTSTATLIISPGSSTFLTSATTISTEALTVTDQSPSTSDKYTTLTYASTVTRSAGTKSGLLGEKLGVGSDRGFDFFQFHRTGAFVFYRGRSNQLRIRDQPKFPFESHICCHSYVDIRHGHKDQYLDLER